MFIAIFCTFFLMIFGGVYWLAGRWLTLSGIALSSKRSRIARSLLAVSVVVLCGLWRAVVIIVLHIILCALVCELAALIVRRFAERFRGKKAYSVMRAVYRSAAVPLLVTALVFAYGFVNMRHIYRTEYTVVSEKLTSDFRVILLADTHFGSVQSPKILAEKIDEINALKPDAVILGGDIVDESATLEDVYECFEIFGRLESRCGTFYVYGNHDRQEYSVESERAYTERELADAIGSFGITVLRDEEVALSEEVTLVGREDRSSEESDRLTSAELLKDADRSKFIIVADHQPVETAENAAQGADLQVSGHTHAGQIFPLGVLIELSGRLNYGEYKVDGMTAIVSSGTAGWGFPIRTQEHCEYVLIDIVPAR